MVPGLLSVASQTPLTCPFRTAFPLTLGCTVGQPALREFTNRDFTTINGDLMGFHGGLMGFNGGLMGFNGDLMGFNGD